MSELVYVGNDVFIRDYVTFPRFDAEPLVDFIARLNEMIEVAPESVRSTITIEEEYGYEGEMLLRTSRLASKEEIEAERKRLEESNARYKVEREDRERREFERLSKKFGAA